MTQTYFILLAFIVQQPTVDDIVEHMRNVEHNLFAPEGFHIQYERSSCTRIAEPAITTMLVNVTQDIAHKEDMWYSHRSFNDPSGPKEPRTLIARGGKKAEWEIYNRFAFIDQSTNGHGGNMFSGLEYFTILSFDAPLWISRSLNIDNKMAEIRQLNSDKAAYPYLPEFLSENKAKYVVGEAQETIDGAKCWSITWAGMDHIWVDPQIGYLPRKRIISWEPNGSLRCEFHNQDFQEFKAGLWLPTRQEEDIYYGPFESPNLSGQIKYKVVYKLTSAIFGDIPDSQFSLSLPVGTKVFDSKNDLLYTVVDGGENPFDKPVKTALQELQKDRSPWIWINIGAITLLIIVIIWKSRRKRVQYTLADK